MSLGRDTDGPAASRRVRKVEDPQGPEAGCNQGPRLDSKDPTESEAADGGRAVALPLPAARAQAGARSVHGRSTHRPRHDVGSGGLRDHRGRAADLVRSYLAVIASTAAGASRHLTLVVTQLSAQHSARAIRQAGGGDSGACTVLAREVDALARDLEDQGATVRRRLDPRSYRGIIRTAFDPSAQVELDTLARLQPGRGWGSDWPWPVATEERWSHYRTADRAWHRSFTLALPLGAVPEDCLA